MLGDHWLDAWFGLSWQTAFTLHGSSDPIPMLFLPCGLDTSHELLNRIWCGYSQHCYKPHSYVKKINLTTSIQIVKTLMCCDFLKLCKRRCSHTLTGNQFLSFRILPYKSSVSFRNKNEFPSARILCGSEF